MLVNKANIPKKKYKYILFEIILANFDFYLLNNSKNLSIFYKTFANKVTNIVFTTKYTNKKYLVYCKKQNFVI